MQGIRKLINQIEDNGELIEKQLNKNKNLLIIKDKDKYKLMIQGNNNINTFREE